jgi:hypothetical protein
MRLVSLCPSLTELVFDLGVGDALVGRTRFCIHPSDRVGAVESVGGTKNPKLERIIALAPDLVLMNDEENRIEDARALEAAGIRVLSWQPWFDRSARRSARPQPRRPSPRTSRLARLECATPPAALPACGTPISSGASRGCR